MPNIFLTKETHGWFWISNQEISVLTLLRHQDVAVCSTDWAKIPRFTSHILIGCAIITENKAGKNQIFMLYIHPQKQLNTLHCIVCPLIVLWP